MKKYLLPNLLTAVIVLFSTVLMPVFAASSGSDTYSLTVKFTTEDYMLSGVKFKAYNAFDRSGKLRGDFSDYEIDDDPHETDSLGDLALTLASYASRDGLTADLESETNARGEAVFSGIPRGIYLVVGESATVDGIVFTPKPFIVWVPYRSHEGELVTDVVAEVKYDRRDPEVKTVQRSVEKVWNDGDSKDRPKKVTVQLLMDGKEYDRAVLNSDNKWRHTWTELDADHTWEITEEEVPEGYTVKISFEHEKFTITNTMTPPPPPPSESEQDSSKSDSDIDYDTSSRGDSETDNETSSNTESEAEDSSSYGDSDTDYDTSSRDGSESDSESETESSSNSTSESSSSSSTTTTDSSVPDLPQTGQLKWPVPVLFISGVGLFLAGVVVTRLNDNEKN